MSLKVPVPVHLEWVYTLAAGTSQHISDHCCIAADGKGIPPMIIFRFTWRPKPVEETMDSEVYYQWFTRRFLPHAVRRDLWCCCKIASLRIAVSVW